MWTQVSGGNVTKVITSPTSLTINDITHPKSIFTKWTAAELKNIGIYPYREDSVDEVVGSYVKTDRDVIELKKGMIEKTRQIAQETLSRTDWMSIREAEGGTAMPDNFKTFRAAIRTESGTKEDEINALSNLDAIKLYEATPFTEVRKVANGDGTYGPTTESSTQHINLVMYYEASDPLARVVDPAFVSLTKD